MVSACSRPPRAYCSFPSMARSHRLGALFGAVFHPEAEGGNDGFDGRDHPLERDPLEQRVHVHGPRPEVGCQDVVLERELGAVGTAADGLVDGRDAEESTGPHQHVHHHGVMVQLLHHVAVGRLDGDGDLRSGVLLPGLLAEAPQPLLHLVELRLGEGPQEEPHLGLARLHGDVLVGEPVWLSPARGLGQVVGGQAADEGHHDVGRVHHLAVGGTRVDVLALDDDRRQRGVEAFVLDLAELAGVHRVGDFGREVFEVDVVGALPDLLVRVETDADFAVGDVLLPQTFEGRHDDGDARLVVGTEQGLAAGGHDGVTQAGAEHGVLRDREDQILVVGVEDVGTAVVIVHPRLDVLARSVGRSIEVLHEPDGGHGCVVRRQVRGKRRVHVPILAQVHVAHADAPQVLLQHPRQVELARRARTLTIGDIFARRRVNSGVAQEALEQLTPLLRAQLGLFHGLSLLGCCVVLRHSTQRRVFWLSRGGGITAKKNIFYGRWPPWLDFSWGKASTKAK